jgi:hypothetical protein
MSRFGYCSLLSQEPALAGPVVGVRLRELTSSVPRITVKLGADG